MSLHTACCISRSLPAFVYRARRSGCAEPTSALMYGSRLRYGRQIHVAVRGVETSSFWRLSGGELHLDAAGEQGPRGALGTGRPGVLAAGFVEEVGEGGALGCGETRCAGYLVLAWGENRMHRVWGPEEARLTEKSSKFITFQGKWLANDQAMAPRREGER